MSFYLVENRNLCETKIPLKDFYLFMHIQMKSSPLNLNEIHNKTEMLVSMVDDKFKNSNNLVSLFINIDILSTGDFGFFFVNASDFFSPTFHCEQKKTQINKIAHLFMEI